MLLLLKLPVSAGVADIIVIGSRPVVDDDIAASVVGDPRGTAVLEHRRRRRRRAPLRGSLV